MFVKRCMLFFFLLPFTGPWSGVATVYDPYGLRIGKPVEYQVTVGTAAEADQPPLTRAESVVETWTWFSNSSSSDSSSKEAPLPSSSTWVVSPSACGLDIDALDGSYSLDRGKGDGSPGAGPLLARLLSPEALAAATSPSAGGLSLGVGRCVEHMVAIDDDRRVRCVCVFGRGDGRPVAVVLLNETRVGGFAGPAVGAAGVGGSAATSATSVALGGSGGEAAARELALPAVSLDVLAQAPWVGDMTLRRYAAAAAGSSRRDSSRRDSSRGVNFGAESISVAKLELLFNWTNVNFFPKKTTLRAGFGARAGEEESFWTDGRLHEHPLWGKKRRPSDGFHLSRALAFF
jgi:hypothetical protein